MTRKILIPVSILCLLQSCAPIQEPFELDPNATVWSAIKEGDIRTLDALHENGADLDEWSTDPRTTPLMVAVNAGQTDAAAWLIDNGADVNLQDESGNNALIAATFLGRADIVPLLLDGGADVLQQNYEGNGPFDVIESPWELTNFIANDLLQMGVTEDEVSAGREKVRPHLEKALQARAQDNIWIAMTLNDAKAVAKLLKEGTDANQVGADGGLTLLMMASLGNNADIAELLLQAGADIDARHPDSGTTSLQMAAFLGNAETAKVLIDGGADATITDYEGSTVEQTLDLDWGTTEFIASMLQIELDRDKVTAAREEIRKMLKK